MKDTHQLAARKAAEEIDALLGQVDGRENLIQAMTGVIETTCVEAFNKGYQAGTDSEADVRLRQAAREEKK
jgi:hypothetical protein